MPAGRIIACLAVVLVATPAAAQTAEPFRLRAEGSFPLQYIESSSSRGSQHSTSAAPYFGLIGTVALQPGWTSSVFANGGHPTLGSFRENDNTFFSGGADLVRRWDALRAGVSLEYTQYYDGIFASRANTATDANAFASYTWRPSPDWGIRPGASLSMRMDETFDVERYGFTARVAIERRLYERWWIVASPRFRYTQYVGAQSGRRDARVAFVGGLRYDFNDSVSLSMLAGYDKRTSTLDSRNGERFTAGASLDFDIDFTRPRGFAAR